MAGVGAVLSAVKGSPADDLVEGRALAFDSSMIFVLVCVINVYCLSTGGVIVHRGFSVGHSHAFLFFV